MRDLSDAISDRLDYRKLPRALSKVYYDPSDDVNTIEFDKLFDAQTVDEPVREDGHVEVWGRKLHVPRSTSKVAEFTFDKLCNSPLSAADYIELTRKFDTIFIRDIPQLTLSERDQARRFILFIDACYESKVRPLVTGARLIVADQALHPVGRTHHEDLLGQKEGRWRDHAAHARDHGRSRASISLHECG